VVVVLGDLVDEIDYLGADVWCQVVAEIDGVVGLWCWWVGLVVVLSLPKGPWSLIAGRC
jgi:hypothetical protein